MESVQLGLFDAVLASYTETASPCSNEQLYQQVAQRLGMSEADSQERIAIGKAGALRNKLAQRVRWCQQTLKQAGVIERLPDARGIWQLTTKAGKALHKVNDDISLLGFTTDLGAAILSNCSTFFSKTVEPIHLLLTSPPYPLRSARAYGNPDEREYVDWLCRLLDPIIASLAPGASVALNVSNDCFLPGTPARSMYVERLMLALHDRFGLFKMDTLIWENKSKPPGPIQWASKERSQLNVSYEPVLWLTNDPEKVFSNNRRVLQPHSERHLKLIQQGGENREGVFSDGAYRLKHGSFGSETLGSIPKNVLSFGHRCASQLAYKAAANANGLPVHGAPMPLKLALFLVEFLSMPGQLVVDPFSGSMTIPLAAEELNRRWLATECMLEYVLGGRFRFMSKPGYTEHLMAA